MSIIGIESLIYGVEDLAMATRYFEDFGLKIEDKSLNHSRFRLQEGSNVYLHQANDPVLPVSEINGYGVREVILGVDREESLERLTKDLGRDRDIRRDHDGTAHFLTDCGMALGLRLFTRNPIVSSPGPINTPGTFNRLNQLRKWRKRAYPKNIEHAVFAVEDPQRTFKFFTERLNFRFSDSLRDFGLFVRADGWYSHHQFFFMRADLHMPGFDGKFRFNHACFGVEDLDEIMTGVNYMERCGWPKSQFGLGRHRVSSGIFVYLPCPAGGQAEYGTDFDAYDDAWVPLEYEAMFGYSLYLHNIPDFLKEDPAWDVRFADSAIPVLGKDL